MKKIVLKYAIMLPVLLFAIYAGLALLGCVSCIMGASDTYFCNTYCPLAKAVITILLVAYAVSFMYTLYREKTSQA